MANMDKQIRKLSYGIQKKLADLLNMLGPRNWKALISVMPENEYTLQEVRKCSRVNLGKSLLLKISLNMREPLHTRKLKQ